MCTCLFAISANIKEDKLLTDCFLFRSRIFQSYCIGRSRGVVWVCNPLFNFKKCVCAWEFNETRQNRRKIRFYNMICLNFMYYLFITWKFSKIFILSLIVSSPLCPSRKHFWICVCIGMLPLYKLGLCTAPTAYKQVGILACYTLYGLWTRDLGIPGIIRRSNPLSPL